MRKPSMKSLDHNTDFHETLLTNFTAETRKPQLKTNQSRITQECKKKGQKNSQEFSQEETEWADDKSEKPMISPRSFLSEAWQIKKSWSSNVLVALWKYIKEIKRCVLES